MTPSRARRWLRGYQYLVPEPTGVRKGESGPVVLGSEDLGASFLDLVELLLVKSLVEEGLSLQRVRKVVAEAKRVVGLDHPLAHRSFYLMGQRVFLDVAQKEEGAMLEMLSGGQLAFAEVVSSVASKLDFSESVGFAERYWPLGKKAPILIDPLVAFGSPCIEGTGVRTGVIYDFYVAEGESASKAADWFRVSEEAVAFAASFEGGMRAA